MAAINQAVDAGDSQTTFNCLCDPQAHLPEVEDDVVDTYQTALAEHKARKAQAQVSSLGWVRVAGTSGGVEGG